MKGTLGGLIIVFVLGVVLAVGAINLFSTAAPHLETAKVACPVFCEQRNNQVDKPGFWDYVNGWILGGVIQQKAHELDPRGKYQPENMGCYCDVQEIRGRTIHFAWEGGNTALRDFHLTHQLPGTHKQKRTKGSFYHKDNCPANKPNLNVKARKSKGCLIYAVDLSHNACGIYNVSVDTVLNGTDGNTIWQELGDNNFDSNISKAKTWGNHFNSPVESLEFGSDITDHFQVMFYDGKKKVHVSQRFLMNDPSAYNFTLWKPLVCKNTTKVERTVPRGGCPQNCSQNCTDKGMMYYDSKCAKSKPGKTYKVVTEGNDACDTSAGEKCWCSCTGATKYYWEVQTSKISI